MTFEQLTTPTPSGRGRYAATIPEGWEQGRGVFGGLALATMARAAAHFATAPDWPLRTLTAEIFAPVVAGAADLAVEELRHGSGTATFAVRLAQAGAIAAHAVAIFGRARAPGPAAEVARPHMPPWRDVPVIPAAMPVPTFARHFEYRLVGPPPAAGAEARAAGWVRPRDPGHARDGAYILALADGFWPALFGALSALRPMATITFTVDIVGNCDGLDPAAPFFHDAHTLASYQGYAPELRTLWGEDGRLLALNHQTFVLIR